MPGRRMSPSVEGPSDVYRSDNHTKVLGFPNHPKELVWVWFGSGSVRLSMVRFGSLRFSSIHFDSVFGSLCAVAYWKNTKNTNANLESNAKSRAETSY